MKNAKTIVLLVIFGGILLYLLYNGPALIKETREALESRPLFRLPEKAGEVSVKKPAPSQFVETATSAAEKAYEIPDYLIPAGFTREQLSQYFDKIQISSISAYSSVDYPASVYFYSSLSENESVNVAGWKLKTNKREFEIPKAVKIYKPEGENKEEDIIFSGGQRAVVYLRKSPLGKNLRRNQCTGYLNNTYDFNPDLPKNCPSIPRDSYKNLFGECQSYIMSLGNCEAPSVEKYNSFPGTDEGNACRQFLNGISFGECYRSHFDDKDFLSDEWRIWIDWGVYDWPFFDLSHDTVRLYDKSGLLVSQYIY